MIGYLLNFYKHSPLRDEILENDDMRNKFKNEFVRNIVWSNFDRLEVRQITDFQKYRSSEQSEKMWVGERQFSMIYDVSNEECPNRLSYVNNPQKNKCKFAFKKTNATQREMEKFRFFGISMIDLTTTAYDSFFSMDKPIESAREKLLKTLDVLRQSNNILEKNICYEVFGSLGGNDIVIIWLTNQLDDVVVLAEALRKCNIKGIDIGLVSNIYTILGIRDIENSKVDYSDVRGDFHIHLTKRQGFNETDFKKELQQALGVTNNINESIQIIAGEYDICINLPCNIFVPKLYSANGLIHMSKSVFYNNFIQSNTEIAINTTLENLETTVVEIPYKCHSSEQINIGDKEIYDLVDDICKSDMLVRTPYLGETLWILYADYMKNITSVFSHPWTQDLNYQFKSCLECLKSITVKFKSDSFHKTEYNAIEFIIRNLRQIILHIAQANRIFFEIPNTHLKHTGTYSKILRAYQGIVKNLIKQAYLIPKKNEQTEIIPFVTFDTIPIPKSKSFGIEGCNKLLVEIKLPYEALVDIKHYTYLLAHEIYHYIAPSNRICRNEIIAMISLSIVYEKIMMMYVQSLAQEEFNQDDEFCDRLEKLFGNKITECAKHYVINNFKDICSTINEYDVTQSRKDFLERINLSYTSKLHKNEDACNKLFDFLTYYNYDDMADAIKNSDDKDIVEKILQYIKLLKVNNESELFEKWIRRKYEDDILSKILRNYQKALTETIPDLFMVQVANVSEKVYFNEIIRSKDLLADSDMAMEQEIRISLMYNYYYLLQENRLNESNVDEWKKTIALNLVNSGIKKEQQQYLWNALSSGVTFIVAYDDLLKEYFSLLDFGIFSENNAFKNGLKNCNSLLKYNTNNDFEGNILFIEKLQIQDSLESLVDSINKIPNDGNECGTKITEHSKANVKKLDLDNTVKIAKDFNSLLEFLNQEVKELQSKKTDEIKDEIWFRGHSKTSYKLIPSIYRLCDEKSCGKSLREMMETYYKLFKVKSFRAPEIFNTGNDTTIGIMSSMQHYSLPTNILDWTPAVLNAIYFAVEPFMLGNEPITPDSCAEIWLLNPLSLNEYRISGIPHMGAVDKLIYPIPAIMDDEESFEQFLPLSSNKSNSDISNLPLAVYVPYVNQRIKAQSGTFTMFSLDLNDDNAENLLGCDLLEVQNSIKASNPCDFKPFLSRVRISSLAIEDIIEHLKIMGIQKHTIYPELENIASNIKNQVLEHLKN